MHAADHTHALRSAGLRVTAPRIAVLEEIARNPHADADSVARGVRDRLGTVSRQAVYDVLHALTDASLVRRVSVGSRSMRYELDRRDNHHHLVCRRCDRLEDVPCAVGSAPCLHPADDHDFEVEIAEVVYRGLCSRCREAESVAAPATGRAPAPSAP